MNRVFAVWILALSGCFRTVGPRVQVTELPAPGEFPHELFDQVLQAHVDDQGKVDYASIQQDRETLDRYTATLALLSPHSHPDHFPTQADELAYWINAYNALAVTGVIDRPGLTSVFDNKVDYFYATRYRVGGKKLDLYRMENGVVRKDFAEPRIHFALNCQSIGCPQMLDTVFDPDRLDQQLAQVSRAFVTDPDKVRMTDDGAVEMSEIFSWYAKDFEPLGGPVASANSWGAQIPADAEVRWIPYDWGLIAQPGKGP